MLLVPRHGEPLQQLANRIRLAAEPDADLMVGIVAACSRTGALKRAGKTTLFDSMCRSGAWLEAALALVTSELPNWSVRRLVRDGETWLCSLSRSPNMPIEFDDVVEASHENMALAILSALVEVKRGVAAPAARTTADAGSVDCTRICCDNFA